MHHDDPSRVGGLGLVTVTPKSIFVLALMLSISFALVLRSRVPNTLQLIAHVVALAFLLPGLPGYLEQYPRFSTAWLHVGLVQAIIVHRHPIVGLDARFSWPGFFTAMAAVVGMANLGNALPLLRWAPLVFNLAYCLPVFVIARALLGSSPRAWMVTWLFILTNWVGQDYFSPQAFGYFILLACLAIVLIGLPRAGRPVGDKLLRGLLTRLGDPGTIVSVRLTRPQRVALIVIAMLASIALSMEHQLTPVALAIDLVALCLARQTSARFFTAAVVLSVLVWVGYGAYYYWEGHLIDRLTGGGGTQAVQTTVAARIVGSRAHEVVVYERILFAVGVWLVAGAATIRGFLRRRPLPLAAIVLGLASFLTLAVQSYGGEGTLRIYLYTLPFMLILIVGGFSDLFPRHKLRTVAVIAVASTAIVPLEFIARYGNEQFEQITAGDVAPVRYAYSTALPGASLWTIAPNGVWGYQGYASYRYPEVNVTDYGSITAAHVLKRIGRNPRGSYLLITPGQIQDAVVNSGAPPDWADKLEARLAKNRAFRLLYKRDGGRLYEVIPQEGGANR